MVVNGVWRVTANEGGEETDWITRHLDAWDRKNATKLEENPDMDADEIIGFLEGEAEGGNYHGMIHMYRKLYDIVKEVGGKEVADLFIAKVANDGGILP